jgi:hypothetical protein
VFWEALKFDLKELFDAFHEGKLEIERLNNGINTLIPKILVSAECGLQDLD